MSHTQQSDEGTLGPNLIGLDDAGADDTSLAGAKAAALAKARQAGLPVLDGFVLSSWAATSWPVGRPEALPEELADELHRAWRYLNEGPLARSGGGRSVVVRSSSPNEDGATTSLAGQFRSVLDVQTWDRFLEAVDEVVESAGSEPMAVLVQRFVQPVWGGVLFGADPVTGRRDRLVVAAVPGGPHHLVSGTETGRHFVLSRRGRILDAREAREGLPGRAARRSLARLADQADRLFGGPQDIEWAIEQDGSLVLLQSRPITAIGAEAGLDSSGPILGPGPIAETFPEALSPLEEDLWVQPLRDGLRRALRIIGVAPAKKLRSSPIVVTIDGRPAVDLELLGSSPVRRPALARLDPRPPARRMLAAWRVGRLRAALPSLAADIAHEVDADLGEVPALETLSVKDLLRLLDRSAGVLTSLHGYEVLAGQLLSTDSVLPGDAAAPSTAASRALAVLAAERAERPDASDDELVASHPVLLSLTAPAIGRQSTLPPAPPLVASSEVLAGGHAPSSDGAAWREALRLRIRWVQELTARAALVLGHEMVQRGILNDAEDVRHLPLAKVQTALAGREVDLSETRAPVTTPLPRSFRQSADGVVVPVPASGDERGGRGAGGGRGMGQVHTGDGTPPPGAVLVVRSLDPALAPLLPGLAGLVSETGSVLSHLAIVAREHGVPTVVDLPGAVDRFPAGKWVTVDGATGEVSAVESNEWRAA